MAIKPATHEEKAAPVDHGGPPKELTQAEKDKDKQPLDPIDAEQLLRAGHRLRKKGDDPSNWLAMTRHAGDMAVSFAASPDRIKDLLSQDLLLASE